MGRAVLLPLVCAAWLVAITAIYAVAAAPAGSRVVPLWAVYFSATAAMLFAWWLGGRDRAWRWVLAAGIVARLVLVPVPTFTTKDVQRYLWDGGVVVAGLDPYRTRPADAEVQHLRARWPVPAEFTPYPTLYPPGAVVMFSVCALLGPGTAWWGWKLLTTACSVAALVIMALLLRSIGRARNLPLVAFCPLLVLEAGVGAHVDILATTAMALALWLWVWGKRGSAGGMLALAAMFKFSPAPAWLPLFFASGSRRGRLAMVAGAAAVVVFAYGLVLAMGMIPFGSLATFFANWRFGSPLGLLIVQLSPGVALVLTLSLAVVGFSVASRWATRAPWRCAMLAVGIPLLLSPVVFPWYLMVLVPLVAMRPQWVVIAWLTTAPLTYEVIDRFNTGGPWEPATWPLVTIATAWLIGLATDVAVARSRRGRQVGTANVS